VVSSGPLGSTRCCGCRGPPACLGGSPECVGRLGRVPGGLEGENRILEAATEPPATGFGVGGGVRRSGPHGEVRGILISVLGHSGPSLYGSGAGRVSIARLAEAPFTRAPRRSAATERGVLRPDQGHGGHARSSPTQSACDEEPGSRRPPGGRVAAWDPNLQIYHDETSYTYTPSSARAARAPCGDDVRAERAPRDRGVH
jgi:hypothetical protein